VSSIGRRRHSAALPKRLHPADSCAASPGAGACRQARRGAYPGELFSTTPALPAVGFFVPGVIGIVLTLIATLVSAGGRWVRERHGTLEAAA